MLRWMLFLFFFFSFFIIPKFLFGSSLAVYSIRDAVTFGYDVQARLVPPQKQPQLWSRDGGWQVSVSRIIKGQDGFSI